MTVRILQGDCRGLLTDVEIERPAFTAPQKTAEVSA